MKEETKKQTEKSEAEIFWDKFQSMPFSNDKIGEIKIIVRSGISPNKAEVLSNSPEHEKKDNRSSGRRLLDEFIKRFPDLSKIGQVFITKTSIKK